MKLLSAVEKFKKASGTGYQKKSTGYKVSTEDKSFSRGQDFQQRTRVSTEDKILSSVETLVLC